MVTGLLFFSIIARFIWRGSCVSNAFGGSIIYLLYGLPVFAFNISTKVEKRNYNCKYTGLLFCKKNVSRWYIGINNANRLLLPVYFIFLVT